MFKTLLDLLIKRFTELNLNKIRDGIFLRSLKFNESLKILYEKSMNGFLLNKIRVEIVGISLRVFRFQGSLKNSRIAEKFQGILENS